jgi:hypothetical protein
MAVRPLCFGARFRDKGRTLKVHVSARDPQRYVVEIEQRGRPTRRREHSSLAAAAKDFARSWRGRLH